MRERSSEKANKHRDQLAGNADALDRVVETRVAAQRFQGEEKPEIREEPGAILKCSLEPFESGILFAQPRLNRGTEDRKG
jgi:hypothetical protein